MNPVLKARCRVIRLCLAFSAIFWVIATRADAAGEAFQQYYARTWQADEGLPRNTITSITQTSDGYLWLCTLFGIIRFDGVTFTPMESDSFPGFTRARSRVIYADAHGRLWVGTGTKGIIRFDGKSFSVIDERNGLPHPTVTAICEDIQGNVWIGCQNGSMAWVDAGDKVHPLDFYPSHHNDNPIQLVRDRNGKLWFAQGNTYGQLVNGYATNAITLPTGPVFLCASRDGGMWVAADNSLRKLSASTREAITPGIAMPFNPNNSQTIIEDRAGNLWIGSSRGMIACYEGHTFTNELDFGHRIESMFQDGELNVWIGTEGGGLNRLSRQIFHLIESHDKTSRPMVLSVCETTNNEVWLAGRGAALMKWSPTTGLLSLPVFTNIATTCVWPRSDGGVYVGTVNRGLFATSESQQHSAGDWPSLRNRQIRTMYRDAKNQLWLGCLPDGLVQISSDHTNLPDHFFGMGLPREAIFCIADDSKGNLWLGTINGALLRYNGTNFSIYRATTGLPGASIGALHFSPDGDLWIGTLGGGLGRLRNGKFAFADTRQGLADNEIAGITEDEFGFFWLRTDRGIVRVRKADINDFMDGNRTRFESILYGKGDGLSDVECLDGYQPSEWRTRSGDIWFATSKGAVVVNPASLTASSFAIQPILEKVLLDDQTITQQTRLKFPHNYQRLEFVYTAPCFTSPEQISFRHRLAGLETNWVEDGALRRSSYPRLPPGKYVFEFTAANREGVRQAQAVAVPFEIIPAYWQRLWFRLLTLGSFGALVAAIVRYRYKQKMQRKLLALQQAHAVEKERMRIARDIHDDLGARLTQMAFLSEMSVKEVDAGSKLGGLLQKIAQSARQSTRSLEETVWAVNPLKDSLPHLVDYLSHYANEYFRDTEIRCRQDLPLIVPEVPLAAEMRHHLFLACKEALNNIRKHARATEVWLRVAVTTDEIQLSIEDNGIGFAKLQNKPGGNGLPNLQSRMSNIGGRCEITSQPGRGTRIFLALPAPPTSGKKSINQAAGPSQPAIQ